MIDRDALDDYLDTLAEAARLRPPNLPTIDPSDVQPNRLSAEILEALNQAKHQTQS
jgi:hypothetical protein